MTGQTIEDDPAAPSCKSSTENRVTMGNRLTLTTGDQGLIDLWIR